MGTDYSQYDFNPTPGPQTPQKYPNTGQHYAQYGELPGFTYNYINDTYIPNKSEVQNVANQAGYRPPKQPSALDTYGPLIGGAAALGIGTGIAKNPTGFFGGIKDAASGLFGLGDTGAAQGTTAAASQIPTATAAAPGAYDLASATGGTGLFGLGSSAAPEAASAAAPASAAGAASGAAAPTSGMFGLGGISGAGLAAAPLAAADAFYSGKGVVDAVKGKNLSLPEEAALALSTFGLSFAYNPIKGMFDQNKWKTEGNKLKSLQSDGVYVPDNLFASLPTHGRKLSDLINKDLPADFVGRAPNGDWVNNKFASSRNVADLKPEDIVNYSAFAEHDPDWFKKPMQDRLALAKQALDSQAVSEGHGSIKVDFNRFTQATQPAQASPQQAPAQIQQPAPQQPIMKDPPREIPPKPGGITAPVGPQMPAPGWGIRQSPGVYKDPNTGNTFNSINGRLPNKK